MAVLTGLSLEKLRENVHAALKLWRNPNNDTSPLEHLYLFQQAMYRTEAANARRATNDLLLQALKQMESSYDANAADILRHRFMEDTPMYKVANQINLAESTANRIQRQGIDHLARILYDQERQAREEALINLEHRLNLPPAIPLFGIDNLTNQIIAALLDPTSGWITVIDGLGGIGKTALANAVFRQVVLSHRFYNVAWVSAKQQEFWPGLGLRPTHQPALDRDTLIDAVLEQLDHQSVQNLTPEQKLSALTRRLKQHPHLIVIDNLETIADFEELVLQLKQLANPTQFLLTSRVMQPQPGLARFKVPELSRADTLALLHHEAQQRRMPALLAASQTQLESIYEVVGGNPLALKLVVGQLYNLPLSQVLENLKQAQGRGADALFTFIYWQAWQLLEEAGRRLLLVMPLAQNGGIDQLAAASGLEPDALQDALDQLITLSLLEISGDLDRRRYRIHRLTETFLLHEVVKWHKTP